MRVRDLWFPGGEVQARVPSLPASYRSLLQIAVGALKLVKRLTLSIAIADTSAIINRKVIQSSLG